MANATGGKLHRPPKTPPPDLHMLDVEDVMNFCGVGRATVYNWMANGDLPFKYVGRKRKITEAALRDFVDSGKPAQKQRPYATKSEPAA